MAAVIAICNLYFKSNSTAQNVLKLSMHKVHYPDTVLLVLGSNSGVRSIRPILGLLFRVAVINRINRRWVCVTNVWWSSDWIILFSHLWWCIYCDRMIYRTDNGSDIVNKKTYNSPITTGLKWSITIQLSTSLLCPKINNIIWYMELRQQSMSNYHVCLIRVHEKCVPANVHHFRLNKIQGKK